MNTYKIKILKLVEFGIGAYIDLEIKATDIIYMGETLVFRNHSGKTIGIYPQRYTIVELIT